MLIKSLLIILFLSGLASCSLFKKKGTWGDKALWPIHGSKIKEAFVKNISNPHVWAPVVGAGVIHLADWDTKISHWASEEKILFDDQTGAENYSDNFNNILLYEMYLSIFLTPSSTEDRKFSSWAYRKVKGGLVTSLSSSASYEASSGLREIIHRERPNGEDHRSLPSGHATQAGARRILIQKNIETTDYDPNVKFGIYALNNTMAWGTMWARVESKAHYPTDVLLGYALGNFVSGFVYDSLINYDPNQSVSLTPYNGTYTLQYMVRF